MKAIIAFSVKHPVSIMSIVTAFFILGCLSAAMISIDFLPVISCRSIIIYTEYKGVSANEMRSIIAIPLEDALASLKNLKNLTTTIRDNLVLVNLELHWGSDIDIALVECREIIDAYYNSLPSLCAKPLVIRNDFTKNTTLSIAITPKDGDLKYARHICEANVKPILQRVPGVAIVNIIGGEKEQILVSVNKDFVESKNVSLQQIADSISANNFEYPAGTIIEGEKELTVKTFGLFTSLKEIENHVISINDSGLIRVADIAQVERSLQENESFFLINGKESVRISVIKKAEASPLTVAYMVKNELENLKLAFGDWFSFEILEDSSIEVKDSIGSLILAAIIGIIVTSVVIYLFFKSLKIVILLSGIIPICTSLTILIIKLAGKSLNIMSLSGLAIGIGMVVDAGTIVLENIQKAVNNNYLSYEETIINAVNEVYLSNTGSTLTTIIVFVPFLFLKGLLGELFSDLAISLISSISISCILSLSYIPSACIFLAPSFKNNLVSDKFIKNIQKKYKKLLYSVFKKPVSIVILLIVMITGGVLSITFLEWELLPEIPTKTLHADITLEPGMSIKALQNFALEISKILELEPGIMSIQVAGGLEPDNYMALVDPKVQKEKISIIVKTTLSSKKAINKIQTLFESASYVLNFKKNNNILSNLLDIESNENLLLADSPEEVLKLSKMLSDSKTLFYPHTIATENVFTPDRIAGEKFSISIMHLTKIAKNALEGVKANYFLEKGKEIPVLIKYQAKEIQTINDFENTVIMLQEGPIQLKNLGKIAAQTNEKILYRYNKKDAKKGNWKKNRDLQKFSNLFSPGAIELTEIRNIAIGLLTIIILLLYLLMAAQFE